MQINYRRTTHIFAIAFALSLLVTIGVLAGTNFEPPSGPTDPASQMYTLEQVYKRANDGTSATKMTTFSEPATGPAATMYDLNAVYALVSERSRPAKTGLTLSRATGDDGELQKGVTLPNPRFTDNGNGTVTDNLTGLIWLKNANCFGTRNWTTALSDANGLASGSCGLSDGSSAGNWRLPSLRELHSLAHYGFINPAVSNTAGTGQWTSGDPFTGVQSWAYWTSTASADINSSYVWFVSFYYGYVDAYFNTSTYYVWPVRGGQ